MATEGCQMVYIYLQTKPPNLGIFWKALEWKMENVSINYGKYVHFAFCVYFSSFWVCCTVTNLAPLHTYCEQHLHTLNSSLARFDTSQGNQGPML
jgi:hypothetical protein